MRVCQGKNNDYVIATRRTNINTTFVRKTKKQREIKICPNEIFDAEYHIINHHPGQVAETWLRSPIKMTSVVRKELEMIVAVSKRKIVAKLEEGQEVPSNAVATYSSAEDLEGKDIKELVKLYNLTKDKENKIKSFGEGDDPAQLTWDAMVEYEVPVKPTAAPKEKVSVSIKDNTIFTPLEHRQHRGESTRTKVFLALQNIGSGTCAEVAAEVGMDEKAVKGYLRPLVADGKVQAFTPAEEAPANDSAE